METSFDLAIVAVLNMHTVDWNSPFRAVRYSNALAIISLIMLGVIAPLLTVFYYKNFSILKQKSFRRKYGTGYTATKFDATNPKKTILAYLGLFVVRRILIAVSAVYLQDFLWG